MVAIVIRALILAFVFGICIAGNFKRSHSKCITSEEGRQRWISEMKKNYTECLEKVKPGADPHMARKNRTYLEKDERIELYVCINMKRGIISENRVYLVDVAIERVNALNDTEQAIKDSLIEGFQNCTEGKDTTADCVEIMRCVHRVRVEVCFDFKKPEEKE